MKKRLLALLLVVLIMGSFLTTGASAANYDASAAVAYAADPSLVSFGKARVGVDTRDGLTLGMTVRDGRHHFTWDSLPEVMIAVSADYAGFLRMLSERI